MSHHQHHDEVIRGLQEEFKSILGSDQGVYVYLDDDHKFCNDAFARLLGYESPEKWAEMQGSFPALFVEEDSRHALIGAYMDAVEKMRASTTSITWMKKGNGSVSTSVILVPIAYQGHVLALHFVTA